MEYYEELYGTWNGVQKYRKYYRKTGGGEEVEHFAYTGRLYRYLNWLPDVQTYTLEQDDKCYSDYAQKLLPRAVGYSAGLLNYFFRGQIEVRQASGGLIIKNASSETMDTGYINIYYDDLSGNRIQLASYPLYSPLAPGQETPVISFSAPTDNIRAGRYIVVFYGKLGNEEGAVVGKVTSPLQIFYKAQENGLYKIYKMDMDGTNKTLVYNNVNNLYIDTLAPSPDGKYLAFVALRSYTYPYDPMMHLLDLSKEASQTPAAVIAGASPNWSPDGKKLVYQKETGTYLPSIDIELFTVDIAVDVTTGAITTGTQNQVTNVAANSYSGLPAWSPDGQSIAYTRGDYNPQEQNCFNAYTISLLDSTGNSQSSLTCQTQASYYDEFPAWRPDGSEITFVRRLSGQNDQLYKVNKTTNSVIKLTNSDGTTYNEYGPAWSPDDKYIAISSNKSGKYDIWLVDPTGNGYVANLTGSSTGEYAAPAFGR